MSLHLDFQLASNEAGIPDEALFQQWLDRCFFGAQDMSVLVRVVDELESQQLNFDYRGKDKPTNVLSFPFELPAGIPCDHLGDLVICAAVVEREALEQGKSSADHWAHMLVHGVLHLQGFDHIEENDAQKMEALEVQLLRQMGITDPYLLP